MKRRAVIELACGAALLSSPSGGPLALSDGRVGSFRIDVTTEEQLRAVAGRPIRVEKQPAGRILYYDCGRACETAYSINTATGKLSDYWTTSPRFVTSRGSHVGMSGRDAARLEGKRLVPGCGDSLFIHVRWDPRHQFVLTVVHGAVHSIAYVGPHSIYDEGLC